MIIKTATKSVQIKVTIQNSLTVMVKVLCQEIVLQFIVFTDDGSWDGNVPETRVLVMSSTSVLGEVRDVTITNMAVNIEFEYKSLHYTYRYDPIFMRRR